MARADRSHYFQDRPHCVQDHTFFSTTPFSGPHIFQHYTFSGPHLFRHRLHLFQLLSFFSTTTFSEPHLFQHHTFFRIFIMTYQTFFRTMPFSGSHLFRTLPVSGSHLLQKNTCFKTIPSSGPHFLQYHTFFRADGTFPKTDHTFFRSSSGTARRSKCFVARRARVILSNASASLSTTAGVVVASKALGAAGRVALITFGLNELEKPETARKVHMRSRRMLRPAVLTMHSSQ